MKILVIAPHPDDEVLGCGGTIKKYADAGEEVYLCIVTRNFSPEWTDELQKEREKEVENVRKILGIKKVFFLNLPNTKLDTIPQKEINDAILKCIKEVGAEVLYIPYYGDVHKDHRLIFEAAMVAARPKVGYTVKKILCYEVISETDWAFHYFKDVFSPNVYVDISKTLNEKIKAILCYKMEMTKEYYSFDTEGVKVLARKRGIDAGINLAEAFVLVRDIEDLKNKKVVYGR